MSKVIEQVEQEILRIIKDINMEVSIYKFKDKVDWKEIFQYQELSEEFREEFKALGEEVE